MIRTSLLAMLLAFGGAAATAPGLAAQTATERAPAPHPTAQTATERAAAPQAAGVQPAFAEPAPAIVSAGTAVVAPDPALDRLEREIERLAEIAEGTVGVAAVHLETGRSAYLNPDVAFPMASTYKVPIAVQLLTRVDRGEVPLDSMIHLGAGDLHPGSGTLADLFDDPGVALSLHNLLELMLLISDNSATDLVLDAAGGADVVTARMRELGVDGIRVDRPTADLIADYIGIGERPPARELTPERFRDLARQVPDDERERASAAFDRDPRDTATPRGMATLLEMIWGHEGLSDESAELLIDIMRRCETGENRLEGSLPPGTTVYHKTGTIGRTTNDVGIIELPGSAGHVVTVVFVKESERSVARRERAIAEIARAVHDYFAFVPAAVPASN